MLVKLRILAECSHCTMVPVCSQQPLVEIKHIEGEPYVLGTWGLFESVAEIGRFWAWKKQSRCFFTNPMMVITVTTVHYNTSLHVIILRPSTLQLNLGLEQLHPNTRNFNSLPCTKLHSNAFRHCATLHYTEKFCTTFWHFDPKNDANI